MKKCVLVVCVCECVRACGLCVRLTHAVKRYGNKRTTSSGQNKHDLVVYFLVLKCDHVLCSVDCGIYIEVINTLWDFVLVLTCTHNW